MNVRKILPWLTLAAVTISLGWALSFERLPPADFIFWNETEITSVDPQIITGVPEARIAMALYEGLVNWDAETLKPLPGVAQSWTISPDSTVFTFHLRDNAKWSDGKPLTAQDYHWAWRRLLDPKTGSPYVYQLSTYVKNGAKYNAGEVNVGDLVEVEFARQATDLPGQRGRVLYGKLTGITNEPPPDANKSSDDPRIFAVEIAGETQHFTTSRKTAAALQATLCDQVLPDFSTVGIKALDDKTLEVTLAGPTPFFLHLSGFHTLFPVQRACVEKYGYPEFTRPGNLVSNGAFTLAARQIRDRIRLVKNPHYWDAEHVQLNTVEAIAANADATALNLYLTRKVDWIVNVPATAAPVLHDEGRKDLYISDEMSTAFYRFNTTHPPLNDARVRKALALAVDRQKVIDTVLLMGEKPAYSLVPTFLENYEPEKCVADDLEMARRLLDEAGYRDRSKLPKFTILCNDQADNLVVAELLQYQWRQKLGVACGIEKLEWNAYLTAQSKLQYDFCRAGWTADYLDPQTFLGMFVTDNEDNMTGWSNPQYDELIEKAKREPNAQRRRQHFQAAERILMDELPIVPFYFRRTKQMIRPYVHGIYPNSLDVHPLRWVTVDLPAKAKFLAGEGSP